MTTSSSGSQALQGSEGVCLCVQHVDVCVSEDAVY